jgi:hypothetical protein
MADRVAEILTITDLQRGRDATLARARQRASASEPTC